LEELLPLLTDILDRRWLTNDGRYVRMFERRLTAALQVARVAAVTNATIGLDLAVRALVPEGEVITTAYSFPATYHVLLNQARVTPVFADIDENYCLDPKAGEQRITARTRAIVAVHTYGYPCAVDELAELAKRHNLALIYDAAHAFGSRHGDRAPVAP